MGLNGMGWTWDLDSELQIYILFLFITRYAVMASSCQTLCMWVPGSVLNDENQTPSAPGQFPLTSTNNFVVPPPVANRNSNSYSAGIGGGGGGGSYQPGLY